MAGGTRRLWLDKGKLLDAPHKIIHAFIKPQVVNGTPSVGPHGMNCIRKSRKMNVDVEVVEQEMDGSARNTQEKGIHKELQEGKYCAEMEIWKLN
ncbi:hypothetical protein IFM89_018337 [Coptis chinensis]|uniref:Uncharacterized protein n=1 Tax=Coptis chinensis TaxID=261450 RepID=A0A835IRC1_9MAGN|nr:hypothetical protein IFM89_018337 [Coptis chinensis]